jgi:hypothetical protein
MWKMRNLFRKFSTLELLRDVDALLIAKSTVGEEDTRCQRKMYAQGEGKKSEENNSILHYKC